MAKKDRGEMLKVETPDLDEHEALYFYKTLTFDEGIVLLQNFDTEKNEVRWEGLPDLLIKLARKEDGSKAFPMAHREKMLQWDFVTAMRIVEAMTPIFNAVADSQKKT